jgi:hypothetical protein
VPSWGEILAELTPSPDPATGILRPPDFDGVRHKYLERLHQLTGRSTVVYYTDWLNTGGPLTSITLQDMAGLMEVFHNLPGPSLDLILHSPGGQAEATDSLVTYMRSKYEDVRVFVPLAAMSAATMWALAADRICMGKHSQLGPIDTQVTLGPNVVAASALIAQFQRASDECAQDPSRLSAWLPTLQQYFPGLLEVCADADKLAQSLVKQWLFQYMFQDRLEEEREQLSKAAAEYFANHGEHLSHGRPIDREKARKLALTIENLEADPDLQDAVLSVHHAFLINLGATTALKIVENHLGVKMVSHQPQQVVMPVNPPVAPAGASPMPGTPPATP